MRAQTQGATLDPGASMGHFEDSWGLLKCISYFFRLVRASEALEVGGEGVHWGGVVILCLEDPGKPHKSNPEP